jgi:hypothetical protein
VSKLANAYSRMKDYEEQKDSDFPTWSSNVLPFDNLKT